MGIIRGGSAEYDDSKPTLEELAPKIEEAISNGLESDSMVLKLAGKYYSTDEITLLARSRQVSQVRSLDLGDNQIGDEALKILSESKSLGCLVKLDLRSNKLGRRWEEKLKETGNFPRLTDLKTL